MAVAYECSRSKYMHRTRISFRHTMLIHRYSLSNMAVSNTYGRALYIILSLNVISAVYIITGVGH